ncbi:MAG: T9SS type A sorting domain-containing protein [Bacteroidota bacterium]
MSRFLSFCLIAFFTVQLAAAQPGPTPQIEFSLTFNSAGKSDQVFFGLDVRASDAYDSEAALGESVSMPPWSVGVEARFQRSSDNEYTERDIRGGEAADKNLTKTHILEIKKDEGDVTNVMTVNWDLESWVTVILVNADAETVVTMTNTGSFTFENNSFGDLADTKFTMTVQYQDIPPGLLPVELTSFTSLVQDRRAVLHWETASETNNAGFEVQQYVDGAYTNIGFVAGRGTTTERQRYTFRTRDLASGNHNFRLKQIDFDGTFAYSDAVSANIALVGAAEMQKPYPDPFNPTTQFTMTIAREQDVNIAVYDMLGRHVQTLHQGALSPSEAHQFTFEASNLPSGRYFIRAVGEFFNQSQTVTLLK